jgi:hypothetical protein
VVSSPVVNFATQSERGTPRPAHQGESERSEITWRDLHITSLIAEYHGLYAAFGDRAIQMDTSSCVAPLSES